jgi:hypothetical protein
MLPGYKRMKCSYLMLIRYCARATASGLPVIVMVLSVLPPSRSSQFEMRIIAPLICLDQKEKSRHLFLVYLMLSKIVIAIYVLNGFDVNCSPTNLLRQKRVSLIFILGLSDAFNCYKYSNVQHGSHNSPAK